MYVYVFLLLYINFSNGLVHSILTNESMVTNNITVIACMLKWLVLKTGLITGTYTMAAISITVSKIHAHIPRLANKRDENIELVNRTESALPNCTRHSVKNTIVCWVCKV